jgi:hypothetical protein
MLFAIALFFIGFIESFLASLNVKWLQGGRKLLCFITSYISINIWYYVVCTVIDFKGHWVTLQCYALGFGVGDFMAISFSKYIDSIAKQKLPKSIYKKWKKWQKPIGRIK